MLLKSVCKLKPRSFLHETVFAKEQTKTAEFRQTSRVPKELLSGKFLCKRHIKTPTHSCFEQNSVSSTHACFVNSFIRKTDQEVDRPLLSPRLRILATHLSFVWQMSTENRIHTTIQTAHIKGIKKIQPRPHHRHSKTD